jgi:F-type H+-transporting ATPase subunit delta
MRGSSRLAFAEGQEAFQEALRSGAEPETLAEDLFSIVAVLDSSAALRRAMADPSRSASSKRELVGRIFGGKVGDAAVSVLSVLVAQRWSTERDLTDAIEYLAVEAVIASAEAAGRIEAVEDELFRFGRIVMGAPELRDVLTARRVDDEARSTLVSRLLEGKASPETVRLARQAVVHPRGRRFDRTIEEYLDIAARRREQLTAVATVAVPLDDTQRQRLARALRTIYGRPVLVNVVLDPEVVGGIRVQVGDEVVDGTILRRLEAARRLLAG